MSSLLKKIENENQTLKSIFTDLFDADNFVGRFPFVTKEIPSVNVKEDKEKFEVEVAAPGLSKEDFTLNFDNDLLTIKGEKKVEKKEEEGNYTRKEFSYSSFSRSFSLPKTVDVDKIAAQYKDGVLNIVLPKKEEAKKGSGKEIKIS